MSQVGLSTSPTEEVVAKVNQFGLTKAAPKLGTSPAKLCRWLKANGYTLKRQYVKENQPAPQFQTM